MDLSLKERFLELWNSNFPGAELPLAFFYTNEAGRGEPPSATKGFHCVICDLSEARRGKPLAFTARDLGCGGAMRFFGFTDRIRPNFEYFLSCGIPGELEGERYKKNPDLVREQFQHQQPFEAPGKYIVFKRWDTLEAADEPLAVIFHAAADVLSGLFTLVNYAEPDPYGVITPMGSGCSSIVYYPYRQTLEEHPKAVLGLFDVSARLCVRRDELTLAIPWTKLVSMVNDAGESFLITESWRKVRDRIARETRS